MAREDITEPITQAEKDEALEWFWYWIDERHRIYLNRKAGQPKPWTEDPILLDFKFTNVFRQLDTGTVWLTEHFLEPHKNDLLELLVFNICWYRKFNYTKTGAILGWQTKWKEEEIIAKLQPFAARREQIITGAHFSIAMPGVERWKGMVFTCTDLWEHRKKIVQIARQFGTLEAVFDCLLEVQYIGPFLAYEMVSDMRHTRLLNEAPDILTWANPGGGALRGLRRLGMPHKPTDDAIISMYKLQELSVQKTGDHVPPMEMRDIEHSCCEYDKYMRVKNGEGRPRSKYNGRG